MCVPHVVTPHLALTYVLFTGETPKVGQVDGWGGPAASASHTSGPWQDHVGDYLDSLSLQGHDLDTHEYYSTTGRAWNDEHAGNDQVMIACQYSQMHASRPHSR